MDGPRFDATVKAFAISSRRSALSGVLGATLILLGLEEALGRAKGKHHRNESRHHDNKNKHQKSKGRHKKNKKRRPNNESPGTEVPSTEVPSTEVPSTESPGTEIPSAEAPSAEAPSDEIPSDEWVAHETVGGLVAVYKEVGDWVLSDEVPIFQENTDWMEGDEIAADEIAADEIAADAAVSDPAVSDVTVNASCVRCKCHVPASNNCSCVIYVRTQTQLCGTGDPNFAAADYTTTLMKQKGYVRITSPRAGAIMVFQRNAKCAGPIGHMALVTAETFEGRTTPYYYTHNPNKKEFYRKWVISVKEANWKACTFTAKRIMAGIEKRPGTNTVCADWGNLSGVNFYVRAPNCCTTTF